VKKRAAQQAHSIKARIDRARPDAARWARRGWEGLPRRLSLGPLGCLRIEPKSVRQRTPGLEQDTFRTAFIVEGKLALEPTCDARDSQPGDLPPLTVTEDTPETRLELPIPHPWSSLGPRIIRAASAAPDAPDVKKATVRGARLDGEPVVVLQLEVEGACGTAWMAAHPWYSSESSSVRLKDLQPLFEPGSGLARKQLTALSRSIAESFQLPLAVDPRHTSGLIDKLIEASDASVDELDVLVELEPTKGRLLVGPDALIAIVGLQGHIRVEPK
jgi:hypothetical protein